VSEDAVWYTKGSSQSKVCQLDTARDVNQQILRLQITVYDSVAVTVRYAT